MKNIKWLVTILVTIVVSMVPVTVLAATTAVVTVTNTPYFSQGISSFTITYVSDTEMDLNWTVDDTAANVMIRAKYGSYPTDIPNENTAPSDGYLVYYGTNLSAVDTSMDFNENAGSLYYKAWAQKADGTWYVTTSKSSKESREVLFLTFVVIALGLTIAAFIAKTSASGMLRIASVIAWIIMIPLSFAQSWPTSNTYLPVAVAFFCAAMMLIMVVATVTYYIDWRNTRRTHEPTDEEYQASYAHQVRKLTKKKGQWD